MIREASAMTVRKNLGELLNEVSYRHDAVVIKKGGKPVAALVDMELFEKIRLMREEFDRLATELARAYQGDEAAVAADLNEAIGAIRQRG